MGEGGKGGGGELSFDDLIDGADDLGTWTAGGSGQNLEEEAPQVVRFRSDSGAGYAVEGELVREVLGWSRPASLPGAPDYILGIVVRRRQVIGMLDLDRWFGLPSRGRNEQRGSRIVVVENPPFMVGLPAVTVSSVEPWPLHAPVGSPDTLSGKLRRYTREVRVIDGEPVVWIDVRRILEDAAVRG